MGIAIRLDVAIVARLASLLERAFDLELREPALAFGSPNERAEEGQQSAETGDTEPTRITDTITSPKAHSHSKLHSCRPRRKIIQHQPTHLDLREFALH